MAVYFTSDLHLDHTKLNNNVRKKTDEEVWTLIKTNWNKKVKSKKDIVYILGDISLDNPDSLLKLKELNGIKYIVGGNHDTKRVCKRIKELDLMIVGCIRYKEFMCTHIPIHPKSNCRMKGNIHGHIHDFRIKDYRYINVCMDLNNYTPLSFDEVLEMYNKQMPFYKKWCLKFNNFINNLKKCHYEKK